MDIPNSDFRITEIEEPATTGCAINPSSGMRSDTLLSEPFVLPDNEPLRWDTPQQRSVSNNTAERYEGSARTVQRMPPVAPPEPPVLLIVLFGLLFLLFAVRRRVFP